MKILFARRGYSSSGGAERYLIRLVTGLRARGIETTLLNDGPWPAEIWPGDHHITLPADSPSSFAQAVTDERKKHPGALLFSFERIPCADVFRAGDGVHASYLRRLATECSPLATWFRRTRRNHRETCQLETQLFTENKSLHVICNSEMVARELREMFNFPNERLTTIYNGFTPKPWDSNEKKEAQEEIRAELAIPNDAPIILFVGSGWKRKGVEPLVSAFKKIENQEAHLIVVGKGRLKQNVTDRIHLTGPVGDPRKHFLAADLFALPTLHDPFSNACLEAAAFGLPVLTTDGNGFAEAITRFPGSGQVIPVPRAPERWARALDDWLAKPPPAKALQDLINAHTIDLNVQKTLTLLEKLIARRAAQSEAAPLS